MALTDLFYAGDLAGTNYIKVDSSGNLTVSGTIGSTSDEASSVYIADSGVLALGNDQDDSVTHNGTNTIWTHAVGDLTFDNTLATGSTIFLLGTDTTATDFQIQNNSAAALLTVFGSGKARLGDAGVLAFGAGDDVLLTHDGGTGVTITGGIVRFGDSEVFSFGAGDDVTFTHDGTTGLDIAVTDNDSGALTIGEGANNYLTIDTTNAAEFVTIGQDFRRAAGARDWSCRNVVTVFDDFMYQLTEAASLWILNSGTDAQAIDPALVAASVGGAIRITTGDADGTTAADGSQMVCAVPLQASTGGLVGEARVKINTAITTCSVFVGFTDATGLEEPATNSADVVSFNADDAVGFLYDTDATTDEWWGVAVDSTTADTGNATTGTAPTADVYQTLRIEVSSDGATCTFFINGTQALQLTGAAGVGPDVPLYFTVIACSTTTTSRTVDVDYVYLQADR